jgi:D-alanyl-D-alanine dipeptidase
MKHLSFLFLFFFLTACNTGVKEKSLPVTEVPTSAEHITSESDPEKSSDIPEKIVFDYDTSVWTDIGLMDTSIIMDLKYATTDNFVGEQMYECGRCFLRKATAIKILAVQSELQSKGYALKMFDCYRPRPIQWKLWEKVPDPRYVADPKKGSMHNRGAAVDLTIVDKQGKELDMGTAYDFFGPKAHSTFTDLPEDVLANRELLSSTMVKHGFQPIRTEWWHFSLDGQNYPLSDMLWKCE